MPSKIATSPNLELTVYDDKNVVIPVHLLAKVIKMQMQREGFHLKIVLGNEMHDGDISYMTKV